MQSAVFLKKHAKTLVVVSLLAIHSVIVVSESALDSATADEIGHLVAGQKHWREGTFDLFRVNPPLVRSVACFFLQFLPSRMDVVPRGSVVDPTFRPEFMLGKRYASAEGPRYFKLLRIARWTCLPFTILGGYVCYRWATELWKSSASGLVALLLWSFSPTVLAYGHLITPDLGAASIGVTALYFFWRWLRRPGFRRGLIWGVSLGLALLTKSTWLLALGLLPLTWICFRLAEGAISTRVLAKEGFQIVAMFLVACWLVNLAYGFEESLEPLSTYSFLSPSLGGQVIKGDINKSGNRFAKSWIGSVPVPLPANYVRGVDYIRMEYEVHRWSYLRGEWRLGGWWYYYLYALLIKEPIATWLLGLAAVAVTCSRRDNYMASIRDELAVVLPGAALLALVSSQTGFNHHIRYVLPALPFIFIWISKIGRSISVGDRSFALAIGLGLLWLLQSSLSVVPHSMSYFNELAGGPKNGWRHLSDSNVDWGQDLFYLQKWYVTHPQARPLHVAYSLSGWLPTTMVGVPECSVPVGPQAIDADTKKPEELGPQPGWYCLSIKQLHFREKRFVYFEDLTPIDWVGYTMPVYHITLEQANLLRRRYGIPELTAAGTTRPTSQPAKAP